MKKLSLYFMLFSTIIPQFLICESEEKNKLFSGSIEFPIKLDCDLCLFFNGEKLELEQNPTNNIIQFSFTGSKEIQTIYLLIVQEITCQTEEANTIEHLQVIPNHEYICYKLQAQREFDNQSQHILLTWKIENFSLENRIIPSNCLIFLFDPKLIAGLKIQSWKPENVFRIIPTILANPNATKQELQKAIVCARLSALDIDQIHRKNIKNSPTTATLTAIQ